MKVKKGFVLRQAAGKTVVIATSAASREFHGMVKLNATGRLIWEGLTEGKTEQELVSRLTQVYGIPAEQAQRDVHTFVEQMNAAGFLEA